jgi:isoleucyl-tRNA synthetase
MPHHGKADPGSVLFNQMPTYDRALAFGDKQTVRWEKAAALRYDVNKALELARSEKRIGKSLEANITLFCTDKTLFAALEGIDLKQLCIVSGVTISAEPVSGYQGENCPGLTVAVESATAPKCPRCWMHDEHIGTPGGNESLCPRCAEVVSGLTD